MIHNQKDVINQCNYCGGKHRRGSCPAFHKFCDKCSKKGHFAACCYSTRPKSNNVRQVEKHHVEDDNRGQVKGATNGKIQQIKRDMTDDDDCDFFIGTVGSNMNSAKVYTVNDYWNVLLNTKWYIC